MESKIAKQKELGDFQKADILERRLQKSNNQSQIKTSSITKAEAIEARLNRKLSTAKDVANLSSSRMEAMQTGALIGGGVSLITNV
ncbi:hypothetical protein QAD60_08310 [Helicobacter pylori]|nr:hypothetical protein [Helicobacter pylori]